MSRRARPAEAGGHPCRRHGDSRDADGAEVNLYLAERQGVYKIGVTGWANVECRARALKAKLLHHVEVGPKAFAMEWRVHKALAAHRLTGAEAQDLPCPTEWFKFPSEADAIDLFGRAYDKAAL